MANRETDFATRMQADTALMALLPGGVYQSGAIGDEGITRDEDSPTKDAFDADGWLLASALVRERPEVSDGNVEDEEAQLTSTIQIVETWFYVDGVRTPLYAIRDRMYTLFQGWHINDGFPVRLTNVIWDRDRGALSGANLLRMDWQVNSVLGD